jgi:putative spermidine/putrescine transport system substrate-binding protein
MMSSRKQILRSGLAAATTVTPGFSIIKKPKVTLRVLGTHVTLQEKIRQQAIQDLGFDIQFEPGGSSYVLQKASTRPESFDIYEQWSDSINILWQAQAIQPIQKERLKNWDLINSISKTGRLVPEASLGKGDAPYRILNVQKEGGLGEKPTKEISFLPYVHNVDSFGYNTQFIPEGKEYETESWGWLFDDQWRGKVGLVNAPTIGIFDMALAAEAKGLMKFNDMGNMSRKEVDQLFDIVIELKQKGHFAGVWNSVPESVDFMKSQRVVIESMFSPAVSTLNGQGVPVIYAAPKEGYRAWHGVMCLSSKTTGYQRDAAYEFMNWWLSGWAGAFIARQGYYISVPELARERLSKDEWSYWYDGQEARSDLLGTDGRIAVKTGQVRTGGSYQKRLSNIAVWNTVMDTYEYSLTRWYDFLST